DGSIGAWNDARAASRWHGATLCATAECENFLVHPERVPPWLTRMLRCVALWKCASFQLLQPCVQAHAVGGRAARKGPVQVGGHEGHSVRSSRITRLSMSMLRKIISVSTAVVIAAACSSSSDEDEESGASGDPLQ